MENEFLIDDKIPETPKMGEDTGISNILIDLINDEWEAVQGYNNFLANCDGYPEMVKIIQDIANEENNHIGMLQKLLATVSPNAETIKEGEKEAEEELNNNDMFKMQDPIDSPVTNMEAIQLLKDFLD